MPHQGSRITFTGLPCLTRCPLSLIAMQNMGPKSFALLYLIYED